MKIFAAAGQYGMSFCLLALSLVTGACGITKGSTDTTLNFTSSTSPNDLFSADGMVLKEQKINLFTSVTYENLKQEVAAGGGTVCECFSFAVWHFTRQADRVWPSPAMEPR